MIRAFGVSDAGPVRDSNEDSFVSAPELGLFAVADGMGGHRAGEVAASLAIEAITAFISRSDEDEDVTWPYGIDRALSFHANRLMTAIRLANRRVFRTAENRDELSGMGTTIVAGLVDGDMLVFAGVGDSRIYSLADGALTQLTTDDSWIATLRGTPAEVPPGHSNRR